MHVTALLHLYPPVHCAGAELMLHAILKHFQTVGHTVEVVTNRPPRRRDLFDGVPVEMIRDPQQITRRFRAADVAVTHLDPTRVAMGCARRAGVPLVHVVHNDRQLTYHRVTAAAAQLVVWNSQWIARRARWSGPSMVVYPPVRCVDYPPTPGPHDAVVLLNTSTAKGGRLFWRLAERLPHRRFVGVKGAYGQQTDPPPALRNCEVMAHTPDVTAVYREARVVVMPSSYESFGRVAVEAAAAGVPCVAAPTPGLLEAAAAAAFVPVDDLDGWVNAVEHLCASDMAHQAAAEVASARAVELEAVSAAQLEELTCRLERL